MTAAPPVDTRLLRLLPWAAAARIAGRNPRSLLAHAKRNGWRLHEEPHRTYITIAELAHQLGVAPEMLLTDAGAGESADRSKVGSPAAPAMTGVDGAERRGLVGPSPRRSLNSKGNK